MSCKFRILGLHLLNLRFRAYGWLYIVLMNLALVHAFEGCGRAVTSNFSHVLTVQGYCPGSRLDLTRGSQLLRNAMKCYIFLEAKLVMGHSSWTAAMKTRLLPCAIVLLCYCTHPQEKLMVSWTIEQDSYWSLTKLNNVTVGLANNLICSEYRSSVCKYPVQQHLNSYIYRWL